MLNIWLLIESKFAFSTKLLYSAKENVCCRYSSTQCAPGMSVIPAECGSVGEVVPRLVGGGPGLTLLVGIWPGPTPHPLSQHLSPGHVHVHLGQTLGQVAVTVHLAEPLWEHKRTHGATLDSSSSSSITLAAALSPSSGRSCHLHRPLHHPLIHLHQRRHLIRPAFPCRGQGSRHRWPHQAGFFSSGGGGGGGGPTPQGER